MGVGRWVGDNLIPWALAGIAFVGSFSHLVALGQTHGVHGALAYTTAGCVDAIVAMAARERQRDKRMGRRHLGVVSWPVLVLCGGVTLTLAGNLAMAQHSAWGWVMAGIPATALLLAISMIERRASHTPAATRVTTPPVAGPSRSATAGATNGHTPSAPATGARVAARRGRPTSHGATRSTMRTHWDAEVAEGRIPSGAALNRAAGKDPTYSLGKRYAAAWRGELNGQPR
jgi:Protein of unknown function (DUF2637)